MSRDPLSALRRRLERAELEHLRRHAAELADRLERAEEECRIEREQAEGWRAHAWGLQDELYELVLAQGATLGLTKDGRVGVINQPSPILLALLAAESFMCGFDDDDSQEGLGEKLALVRSAIESLQGQSA